MEKPDFSIVKDQRIRSFLEYVWKRIEREHNGAQRYCDVDSGEYLRRMNNYLMWTSQLNIYMSALNGEIPGEWTILQHDFAEHNSNPSGSDGMFKRTSVDA